MRKFWLLAIAATAIATSPGCSNDDKNQITNHADQVIEHAQEAAETVITKADKAVDKMDDLADKVMANRDDEMVAFARLSPVAGSGVSGRVTFSTVIDGLQVRAKVSGLSPGEHGIHIHRHGNCANNAQAVGPPMKLSANRTTDIRGNLGEFTAADSGTDTELTILHIPVSEIVGKAVVVHAHGNDAQQRPDSGVGAPIACGVIKPAHDDSTNAGSATKSQTVTSSPATRRGTG